MNNPDQIEPVDVSRALVPIAVPTEGLIAKYAVSGPRYTSYPTAVEFTNSFTTADWLSCLAEEFAARPGKKHIR